MAKQFEDLLETLRSLLNRLHALDATKEADDYSFRTLSGPYEHAGYKVFFPTDEDMSTDEVSTANLETGTTQTSGVYAEINILYSLRGSDEIRARAVYGEWSSDNGLTDRLVRVANGLAFVERDEFYPTSNSFYYFLDWDFQEYVDFGDFQPLALSQVVVSDGPFSGNTVTLQVNFG